ncbi:MAG: PIN domain-containing protein [Acidobacteriota bacterium]
METAKLAAALKARHRLPYVDCFGAALACERKAQLVTSDRDFERVAKNVMLLWGSEK